LKQRTNVASALAVGAALVAVGIAGACSDGVDPLDASSPVGLALAHLRAHEDALREKTDFTAVIGRHRAFGPDPYAVALAPGGKHLLGVLRGEDALVLLDRQLVEIARAPAPRFAASLVVDGEIVWVAGEGSDTISRFTTSDASLELAGTVQLRAGTTVRALASQGGIAFAVDPLGDALIAFDEASGERVRVATASAPLRVVATPHWVAVASLIGHRIEVFARDEDGLPIAPRRGVYVRRGPAWSLDGVEDDEGALWLAIGAVEDEALDRTIGAFGHIDSVVEILRQSPIGLGRLATIDVSDHGIVLPKSIAIALGPDAVRVRAVGAGSARGVDLRWTSEGARLGDAVSVDTWQAPAGTSSFVGGPGGPLVGASPLLDAFWAFDPAVDVPPAIASARSQLSRTPSASVLLGEALLTTTLLAPGQKSDGAYSRFTCETCHFELGVDGRTHGTGRQDETAATTKPLYGLLENGPHFTRGLDRDLTAVAHNEVRVANLHVPVDPWFSIDRAQAPWLDQLIGETPPGLLGPLGMRKAMVDALAALAHRPNPRIVGRASLSEVERRGAASFAERCVSCHAARFITNDPATEVPHDAWETLIFSDAGPITWAKDGYEKTGIEPYVHPDGARTTSLRRAIDKRPYFTNGSAATLREVMTRLRFGTDTFLHDAEAPAARGEIDVASLLPLSEEESEVLLAFLQLL